VNALAEKKRGIALRDGNIDLPRLVRLEGAARRAEAVLQLDVKREPEPETLHRSSNSQIMTTLRVFIGAPRTVRQTGE